MTAPTKLNAMHVEVLEGWLDETRVSRNLTQGQLALARAGAGAEQGVHLQPDDYRARVADFSIKIESLEAAIDFVKVQIA